MARCSRGTEEIPPGGEMLVYINTRDLSATVEFPAGPERTESRGRRTPALTKRRRRRETVPNFA